MMLRFGNEDFISFPDKRFAETGGDQIEGSGRSRSKDNLFPGSMEEGSDEIPGGFKSLGCLDSHRVDGPMDIGILLNVHFHPAVKDSLQALGGGSIVQIDPGSSMHTPLQSREPVSDFLRVHKSANLRKLSFI